MRLKNVYFFLLTLLYFSQSVHSQQNLSENILADNYFSKKEYGKSKAIYNKMIKEKVVLEKNSLLKLAFIYEKEKDFPRSLYFLNLYFEKQPSEKVLTKMNNIATENNIGGYELSDFYLILLLIKQYSFVISILLVALGLYVFSVFTIKKIKNQQINSSQKIVFFLYLLGMLILLDLPKIYKQGVVHQANCTLRSDPSSAAPVVETLQNGQRLNLIGSEDIWLRVFRNNKFYYVNKANIWLVN